MSAIETQADHGHGDHDHHPRLAHHWESMDQQFEAGKLGMWLFLATEFLLFGGLFCAYAVFRYNNPEIFEYGSQFLNKFWGATNTIILILSSFTMALAVSAAQLGRQRALITLLTLTFLGGAGFMCIKYVEYKHKFDHNIVWGPGLYVPPQHEEHDIEPAGPADGESMTQVEHAEAAEEVTEVVGDGVEVTGVDEEMPETTAGGFIIPKSNFPRAAEGPGGLAADAMLMEDLVEHEGDDVAIMETEPDPRSDPARPANLHIFFGIYFCMTGLHGFHVLAGMGMIGWLIFRAQRGEFGPGYFTPVDLGGLYWHVVDLIWIFLFPLLYLIA